MADQVNHPPHYQCGGIETIDVIRAKQGPGFGFYCEGNVIKYMTRWRLKDGVRDLRKARVYLDWLIELEEKGLVGAMTAQAQSTGQYEEQAVAHHAIEAPMPPLVELHEGDDCPEESLKGGEAYREHGA